MRTALLSRLTEQDLVSKMKSISLKSLFELSRCSPHISRVTEIPNLRTDTLPTQEVAINLLTSLLLKLLFVCNMF